MILIADGGSSSTRWFFIEKGKLVETIHSKSLNPYFVSEEETAMILRESVLVGKKNISAVYYYGAGCTPHKIPVMEKIFREAFETDQTEINSDLLAAARSLGQDEECIVAILGTGSNSCRYQDGQIAEHVSPLGYILGDEGSGAVLGRKLLSDIMKSQISPEVIGDFHREYTLTSTDIIERVYRGESPNKFLAGFAPFILKHKDKPEIKQLIESSFCEFIERNILQYNKSGELPIHFSGGIAYHFENNLRNAVQRYNLLMGRIVPDPTTGLIEYHIRNSSPL